ncbi:MAG: pyridoxine 5'-phosphate synthase [bacterium]|nr:pyridoxine 5'-phosphate synthase [bacterium]MDT8396117.1 pyridoxine 5'-phosphate synthase [bacterium]
MHRSGAGYTRLGVNVDHVATVRQARGVEVPDPVEAAFLAELGGCDGITIHLREDRRHIQDRDLAILRRTVKTRLNLEMASTQEMVKIALDVKPDVVTLVPERREELTTEGGLEVAMNMDYLRKVITLLSDAEIRVSLFVDPDIDQIKASHRVAAHAVEIHTGKYAAAKTRSEAHNEYDRIVNTAKVAQKLKLQVIAGHGLDYRNVRAIVEIPEIVEVNIGHSIVSRAVMVGMERAVREMKMAMGGTL